MPSRIPYVSVSPSTFVHDSVPPTPFDVVAEDDRLSEIDPSVGSASVGWSTAPDTVTVYVCVTKPSSPSDTVTVNVSV